MQMAGSVRSADGPNDSEALCVCVCSALSLQGLKINVKTDVIR